MSLDRQLAVALSRGGEHGVAELDEVHRAPREGRLQRAWLALDQPVDLLQRRVGQELDRMSVLERTAFVLRHVEGASLEDIGLALDLNIGQSKQAVFRAVRKLRGALTAWREA